MTNTTDIEKVHVKLNGLSDAIKEMTKAISRLAEITAKHEERTEATRKRLELIESTQTYQTKEIYELSKKVLLNTASTKRASWIAVTVIGAFLTGSVGFIFFMIQQGLKTVN